MSSQRVLAPIMALRLTYAASQALHHSAPRGGGGPRTVTAAASRATPHRQRASLIVDKAIKGALCDKATIVQYEAPTGSLEYCASFWGRQHPKLTRLDDMIGNADGYEGKLVAIFQVDANRNYVIWNSPGGCSADGQSKPAFCASYEPFVYWIWLLDYCIVPISWEGG